MSLKTVLVDDEPLAREFLGLLLQPHAGIDVVSECRNGAEAIAYLRNHSVDLLFLDIQMPRTTGFDVVQAIGLNHLPPTIFVTAYHEHAVRAFDVHAVDYLTKPIAPERLAIAIERVRRKLAADAALLTQGQFAAVLDGLRTTPAPIYASRFLVKDGEKEVLLTAEKIEWIEAADYYCCLHAQGRSYMLRETMNDLADQLDPRRFIRIHRSSIVNLDQIREIYREGQAESSIVLLDGRTLRMSKAGRDRLTELDRK